MTTVLRLRQDQLTKLRFITGLDTDKKLADRMGVDPATVSRVLSGKNDPGPKFIASLVQCFPGFDLDDLFEVVTEPAA